MDYVIVTILGLLFLAWLTGPLWAPIGSERKKQESSPVQKALDALERMEMKERK